MMLGNLANVYTIFYKHIQIEFLGTVCISSCLILVSSFFDLGDLSYVTNNLRSVEILPVHVYIEYHYYFQLFSVSKNASISLCLSVCLSLTLSVSVSVSIFFSLSRTASVSIYLSTCPLSLCLSPFLCISCSHLFLTSRLSLPLSLSLYLFPSLPLPLSLSLSFYPSPSHSAPRALLSFLS